MRLARVVTVALLTGTDKLHLVAMPFDLGRAKVLEHRERRASFKPAAESFRHLNATAYDNNINIVARPLQKEVTHVTTYYISLQMKAVGSLRNLMEYILI